jgi:hypothetical protein
LYDRPERQQILLVVVLFYSSIWTVIVDTVSWFLIQKR